MAHESDTTTIENGTKFDGKIESERPVRVSGKVEGTIDAPQVTVAKTGTVRGDVKVGRIKTEGEIGGRIEADEIHIAGRVMRDTVIEAGAIRVDIGEEDGQRATFETCDLRIGSDVGRNERAVEPEPVGATVPVDQRDSQPEPDDEPQF